MGERWHGIRFPFKRTAQGFFKDPEDSELIESSIKMILNTQPGEYICLPEFGCKLQQDLFEPNDAILQSLAKRHIRTALERWEPRIAIIEISAASDEHDLRIYLQYIVKNNPEQILFFSDTFARDAV